jgi:hypothetical protein
VRPGAEELLEDQDMFVIMGSKLGIALAAECGDITAIDATFKPLTYGRIKLIVVTVTSHDMDITTSDTDASRGVKQRGHATFLALVTSEREDVQAAIVLHIKASVDECLAAKHARQGKEGPPPTWQVKIFMSGEFNFNTSTV